jgi:hypothetical protein
MSASAMESSRSATRAVRLTGWQIAAASLLVVAGGFNFINGYTLLERDSYFRNDHILYSNLDFWGWAFLIWGVLQLVAGSLVFARRPAGTYLGVGLATTACILWFLMLFVAPFGMLISIVVNSLILVGLTVGAADVWASEYD